MSFVFMGTVFYFFECWCGRGIGRRAWFSFHILEEIIVNFFWPSNISGILDILKNDSPETTMNRPPQIYFWKRHLAHILPLKL